MNQQKILKIKILIGQKKGRDVFFKLGEFIYHQDSVRFRPSKKILKKFKKKFKNRK